MTRINQLTIVPVARHHAPRVVVPRCSFFANVVAKAKVLAAHSKEAVRQSARVVAQIAAPVFWGSLSAFFSVSMSHTPVGQVVSGLWSTAAGGCMILKSGVCTVSKMKNPPKKYSYVNAKAYALLGGLLIGHGITNTICGFMALYQGFRCRAELSFQVLPGDQERIHSFTESLLLCPAAKKIWDLVAAEGAFSFQLAAVHEIKSSSLWRSCSRTIAIQRHLKPEYEYATKSLYELCYASMDKNHTELESHKDTLLGSQYEKLVFINEYMAVECHREAVLQCIYTNSWNPNTNYFKNLEFFVAENTEEGKRHLSELQRDSDVMMVIL